MTASDGKAIDQVNRLKSILESNEAFREWFGEIASQQKQWTQHKLYRQRTIDFSEPSFQGIGLHGDIVGKHFDIIIYDDLFDAEDIATDTARQNLEARFFGDLQGLTTPKTQIIVIGTRKHWADLYQKLLDSPAWTKIEQRAIIKYPDKWEYLPDGSGVGPHNELAKAEVLWPERWSIKDLLMKRREMGEAFFEREYQNNPSLLKGRIFKREWLQEHTQLPNDVYYYQFWDLAVSTKPEADYSACVTLAVQSADSEEKNRYYLIHVLHEKFNGPTLLRWIKIQHDTWPVEAVGVEANGFQVLIAQFARENRMWWVEPVVQKGKKEHRIQSLEPFFENGQLTMPNTLEPWRKSFIDEYEQFPYGTHDDILDALEGAVKFANLKCGEAGEPAAASGR